MCLRKDPEPLLRTDKTTGMTYRLPSKNKQSIAETLSQFRIGEHFTSQQGQPMLYPRRCMHPSPVLGLGKYNTRHRTSIRFDNVEHSYIYLKCRQLQEFSYHRTGLSSYQLLSSLFQGSNRNSII